MKTISSFSLLKGSALSCGIHASALMGVLSQLPLTLDAKNTATPAHNTTAAIQIHYQAPSPQDITKTISKPHQKGFTPRQKKIATLPAIKKPQNKVKEATATSLECLQATGVLKSAHMPAPSYPKSALRAKKTGLVVITFLLHTNGRVKDVLHVQSCGHHDLDQAATKAIKSWSFDPETVRNHPRIKAPIRFIL